MFAKLGTFAVNNPWRVIAAWVIAAAALIAFGPTIADITRSDQSSFLPDKYESVQAQNLAAEAFTTGSGDTTASIVVRRADGGAPTAAS